MELAKIRRNPSVIRDAGCNPIHRNAEVIL